MHEYIEIKFQRRSAAGKSSTVLTKPDRTRGAADHVWPEFVPGTQAALFTITTAFARLDNAQIALLNLETGKYKVLVRGGSHAHYLRSGHLVYAVGGTLRAVPFDVRQLDVTGTPVPVLEHVMTTLTGTVDVSVAANGTMAYVPGDLGRCGAIARVAR